MKNIIKASAWIYIGALILSMVVAKDGHPWIGLAGMMASGAWLGAFIRANYFEEERGC